MRWESLSSVCTGNLFVHFWYDSRDPSTKKEEQPMLGSDSNSARSPALSPSGKHVNALRYGKLLPHIVLRIGLHVC
jgi:hypothetical protein